MNQKTETATGSISIPADIQKVATALLHQQMWCWGYDIRHPEGNMLLRYTFTYQRPPDPSVGSSRYMLCDRQGQHIVLWGFGIWYAQTEVGGLFLQRYGFSPRLTCTIEPPASIWTPLHLPVLRVPITSEEGHTTLILLSSLLSWIGGYEQWVQENLGEDYRKWSLSGWPHRVIPPANIATMWQRLARDCHTWQCSTMMENTVATQ
ncbi:MAG: hypothetical protein H0V70_23450 [Ktedonobacteraceae bacterium]|nr:hypothetical protein [Ktedonobacteraceae bacterium]